MATIYRVIQIKLNQSVYENVHMITDLSNKAYSSAITVTNISQSFYLQHGGDNINWQLSPYVYCLFWYIWREVGMLVRQRHLVSSEFNLSVSYATPYR